MKSASLEITQSLLMVNPAFFDIEYAINPFMRDAKGDLKTVNRGHAMQQWQNLKSKFEALNLQVHLLAGRPKLPDMVFCANQAFTFIDPQTQQKSVLLSRMRADERKDEVVFFKDWFAHQNYQVFTLESDKYSFEANGDLIPVTGENLFFGGVGPRTDLQVYEEIQQRFHLEIVTLNLVYPSFYHLDTCFFVLDKFTCAYIKEAFDDKSREKIRNHFQDCIEIPLAEGLDFFAGNAFCPDGKNVIIQSGSSVTQDQLKKRGFNIIEVDTSEFMKAGGSVFCMKLALPNFIQ